MDRVVGSPRVFACEADSALRRSPPAHDALSGVNTVLCSASKCMHESTSPECLIKLLRRCLWRLALRHCLWLAALVESILEHKIRGGQGFPKQLCFSLVMELPPMPPPGTNPIQCNADIHIQTYTYIHTYIHAYIRTYIHADLLCLYYTPW